MATGLIFVLFLWECTAWRRGAGNELPFSSANLEDFMSMPARTNLVGAQHNGVGWLAWTEEIKGVVNVVVASEESAYAPVQRTAFNADEGYEIDRLTFDEAGKTLYFTLTTQGGGNPTYAATPPSPQIWSVPTDPAGGEAKMFMDKAALSAVSRHGVSFVRGNSVYQANEPGVAVRLFTVSYGSVYGLTWSAGDAALAFVNDRSDHSFVGVYFPESQKIDYVDPTFDFDTNPSWSPSGQKLAFLRLVPVNEPYGRGGDPHYSVLVATIATETVDVWFNGGVGYGDVGYGLRPMLWTSDDTILIQSEATGRTHVLATNGVKATDLTDIPNCFNQDWILDPAREWLYVSHNCATEDSRAIARIRVSDGKREDVTVGTTELISGMAQAGQGMAVVGANIAFFQTSYNTSVHVMLKSLSAKEQARDLTPAPGFNSKAYVKPRLITFPSADGKFTLHAQLFSPPADHPAVQAGTPLPGVVFTHGGPHRQMFAAVHYCPTYAELYALNQYFALEGFVVISINYRMGVGYGREFRECDRCGALGGAEYADVRTGALWLAGQANVDSKRIGIHGLSYGGLNCLQALARDSAIFKVGVANAPVFNWVSESRYDGETETAYMPAVDTALRIGPLPNLANPAWTKKVDETIKLFWESSPAAFVANFTSPVLIIQGDMDQEVAIQESIGLIRALREKGKNLMEWMMFPNEIHGLSVWRNRVEAAKRTFSYINHYLTQR